MRLYSRALQLGLVCVLALLTLPSSLAEPNLQSATYSEKTTHVLGKEYKYAVFEMQYDEPLAVIDNYPCPCYTSAAGSRPCNITNLAGGVNETGLNITSLAENTWAQSSMSGAGSMLFKVDFQPIASNPCPILVIELDLQLGSLDMYISNTEIPSESSNFWTKPFWGRDSVWLCPTLPWFGYGSYYIRVSNSLGDFRVAFNLKYYFKECASCPAVAPTPPYPAPANATWEWLNDGEVKFGTVSQDQYHYFRYFSNDACTKFAASGRRQANVAADIDIYVSTTNPEPTFEDYQWNGNMDGDDTVIFTICVDPSTLPLVLYFSATTYLNQSPYAVTATTTSNFERHKIHEMGANLIQNQLARGADLICGNETLYCQFGPYSGCYGDGFKCCFPMSFIPPIENPNPIWPRNIVEDSLASTLIKMDWPNYEASVPGKLALGLLVSSRDESEYREYLQTRDWGSCTLRWRNLIVSDTTGMPLVTPVTFTKKEDTCDNSMFQAVVNSFTTITEGMYSVKSQEDLVLSHLNLNFLQLASTWEGCKNLVDKLTTTSSTDLAYSNQTSCRYLWDTPEFSSDPCCNPELAFDYCCAPWNSQVSVDATTHVNEDLVNNLCASRQCSSKIVSDYATFKDSSSSASTGCSANFIESAGDEVISSFTSFIQRCRVDLLGADLLGSSCTQDSDCKTNCLPTGRCNHTDTNVLQCFADSIDNEVGLFLFRQWGITVPFSRSLVLTEMKSRILSQTCVGGDAIRFRDHWNYKTITPFCVDPCRAQDLQPHCLEPNCAIPPLCDRTITVGCWRFWAFVPEDRPACESRRLCNWMDCNAAGFYDEASCMAACQNVSLPQNICADCTDDYHCTEINAAINQTQCGIGYCPADPSISDPSACSNSGTCDITCGGAACTSAGACQAGSCTDQLDLKPAMDSLGIVGNSSCILPYTYADGEAACAGPSQAAIPQGCVDPAITGPGACTSQGGVWHTLASTMSECNAVGATSGCFDWNGVFSTKQQADCLACGLEWRPFFQWKIGTWTPGQWKQARWIQREYTLVNSWATAIDYPLFTDLVNAAVANKLSVSFLTEASCRYDNLIKTVGTVACDCSGTSTESATSCFTTGPTARQIAVGRICPSIQTRLSVRLSSPPANGGPTDLTLPCPQISPFSLIASSRALPAGQDCETIRVGVTSGNQFSLVGTGSLSSEIYKPRLTNTYAVVKNSQAAVVGQIASDGISLDFNPEVTISMNLCIELNPTIEVDGNYTTWKFGLLQADTLAIIVVDTTVTLIDDNKACGVVKHNGTYFASVVSTDWATAPPYDPTSRVLSVIGAAIYYLVVSLACAQIFIVIKFDMEKKKPRRIFFMSVILVFNLIRGAYLTLPPNTFDELPQLRYILFELPSFLFLTNYSIILFLWTEITQRVKKLKTRSVNKTIARIYIIFNVALYALFVLFVLLFSFLGQDTSPCSFGELSRLQALAENQQVLNIVYQVFIALVCFGLAAVFVYEGFQLFRLLSASHRQIGNNRMLITVVAVLCTVSFVARCIAFIYSSATGQPVVIIVFVLLEVIPSVALLFYLRPWRRHPRLDGSSTRSLTMDAVSFAENTKTTRTTSDF